MQDEPVEKGNNGQIDLLILNQKNTRSRTRGKVEQNKTTNVGQKI